MDEALIKGISQHISQGDTREAIQRFVIDAGYSNTEFEHAYSEAIKRVAWAKKTTEPHALTPAAAQVATDQATQLVPQTGTLPPVKTNASSPVSTSVPVLFPSAGKTSRLYGMTAIVGVFLLLLGVVLTLLTSGVVNIPTFVIDLFS